MPETNDETAAALTRIRERMAEIRAAEADGFAVCWHPSAADAALIDAHADELGL